LPEGSAAAQMKPSLQPWATLLTKMAERRDGRPFARPMKELWEESEVGDYFDVVTKPMDLGTVKANLAEGYYNHGAAGTAQLVADVRLVFENCVMYTPDPESVYHQQAQRMRIFFENERDSILGTDGPRAATAADGDANAQSASASKRTAAASANSGKSSAAEVGAKPPGRINSASHAGAGAATGLQIKGTVMQLKREAPVSQEQKDGIIFRLGQLKRRKLRHALDIVTKSVQGVRESMDATGEGEEYELDLDALPQEALWSLHEYCSKQATKSESKAKAKAKVVLLNTSGSKDTDQVISL
jgi:hypothetical protein